MKSFAKSKKNISLGERLLTQVDTVRGIEWLKILDLGSFFRNR